MEKLLILGIIGFLLYSYNSDKTTEPQKQNTTGSNSTEPMQTQPATNPPANTIQLNEKQISDIYQTFQNDLIKDYSANNRLTPPDLESYNRYETSFRLTD